MNLMCAKPIRRLAFGLSENADSLQSAYHVVVGIEYTEVDLSLKKKLLVSMDMTSCQPAFQRRDGTAGN